MKNRSRIQIGSQAPARSQRGSVLFTALVFAIIIVIALVSSITLSTNSLKLAHRTFFADAANNLAETGLEEAVWSFNTMGFSTDPTVVSTCWNGWTTDKLSAVYVVAKGDGYSSVPTVTISGGGGTGATATASLVTYYTTDPSTGATITHVGVGAITLTNQGSGYTSSPTVALTGGGYTITATAVARRAATRTFSFSNLDQNSSGTVKVWVDGYDGTAAVPNIVAKAVISPNGGQERPIEKSIKVILSKNGVLPKGVVAKIGINWNGQPFADSFVSSTTTPPSPPFTPWAAGTARDNTTLASLGGTIDLSQGTVSGNVMTGPGVTVTGHGTITGQQIGNFSYDFTMPGFPSTAGYNIGATVPTILPRPAEVTGGTVAARTAAQIATGQPPVVTGGTVTRVADTPAADGIYYYYTTGATIENVTITAGKKVVIVGAGGTRLRAGVNVPANIDATVGAIGAGSLKIYMDGNIDMSGNDKINLIASPNASWAGALEVYTTTTSDCTFSGNAQFVGCIFAPNAEIRGNGGGNDQADLIGSFVAKSITSNGHMNFHFDEALGTTPPAKPWSLALWRELQTPAERALYATQLNF
jgi:Tfp pilus assembly protein PilX